MPNLTFTHLSIQTNSGFFPPNTATKIGNGGPSLDPSYLLLSLDKCLHPGVNVCLFLALDVSPSAGYEPKLVESYLETLRKSADFPLSP